MGVVMPASSQQQQSSRSTLQQAVWQTVAAIPSGRVLAYGQVAALSGFPGLARQVGRILATLPADSRLPWHRVLRSDGQLAFPRHSASWQRQYRKLSDEGIRLSTSGRVPSACFWQPEQVG